MANDLEAIRRDLRLHNALCVIKPLRILEIKNFQLSRLFQIRNIWSVSLSFKYLVRDDQNKGNWPLSHFENSEEYFGPAQIFVP